MSVYNRKMFKRNARDTLNKSAGIADMPVQKFQAGGSIRIGNNNFMISPGANPKVFQRTGQGTAIPVNPNVAAQVLAQFRSPQLNTRSKFAASTGSSLPMGTVGTSGKVTLDQDQAAGIASLIEQQQDPNRPSTSLVESALRPNAPVQFEERYPLSSATEQFLFGQGAPKTVEGKALRTAVTSIPTMLDFVGVPLLETASQSQAGIDRALSMMTPEREEELLSGAGTLTDKEAAKFNADPTLVPPRLRAALIGGDVESGGVDLIKIGATGTSSGQYSVGEISPEQEAAGLAVAGATPGSQVGVTTTGPTFGTIREAGTYDKTYDAGAAAPTPDEVAEGEVAEGEVAEGEVAGATTEEDREAIREAGTYEKEYTSAKEEIDRVINEGTPEEQEKTLDTFIKEFMDKAPGYEGADQGLILAKMGFAMAAGKSPRAIENIANAMSDGADALIKDKAKRDEFDRQLNLSALKYGLNEVGKIRAESRLAAREGRKLNYFVADEDITLDGKEYKKGQTVPVQTGYILENGLPSGLTTTAYAEAALKQSANIQKALLEAQQKRVMDPKEVVALTKDVNEAATTYASSNALRQLVQGNLIEVAEGGITGFGPAFEQAVNGAANAVGVNLDEDFQSVAEYNAAMRRVSNQLIKELLNEGGRNISNVDRALADEIVGLYSNYGGYIFRDPQVMQNKLQNVLVSLEERERNALNVLEQAQASTYGMTYTSGMPVQFNLPPRAQTALGMQPAQPVGKYELVDGVYRRVN
jgi:hypothetical protein